MSRGDEGRRVEVLLDEGPDEPAAPGPLPAPRRPGGTDGTGPALLADRVRRTRGRQLGPRVAGGLVLVLVAAAGAADARAERRERDALAANADVPGVLGSLAEPLEERWRVPTRSTLTGLGDRVVTVDDGALVGLDAATGERRWSLPSAHGAAGGAVCPLGVPGDGGSGALVCFGVGRPEAGLGGVTAHAVDAGDGDLQAELHGPRVLLAAVGVDGDAVLVGSDAGRVRVFRVELASGDHRWGAVLDELGRRPGELHVHGDRQVVVLEAATTVVLDARDGHELGRWHAASDGAEPARARVVSRPGSGFGVWPSADAGRWYAPDGTPGPRLAGEPVEPDVDDGSMPGLVLLESSCGERLAAVDVASGEQVWDRPAPDRVRLHLDGRLLVDDGGRLEAWDAASGEVAWSVRLGDGAQLRRGETYTDGVRVLVPGEGADGPWLAAYRLADGVRVWRTTLPSGSQHLTVLGDRLAAVGLLDGQVKSTAVLG